MYNVLALLSSMFIYLNYYQYNNIINYITKINAEYNELKQYPLINYCPNSDINDSVIDKILSIGYSDMADKKLFSNILKKENVKSSVIHEIFSVIAKDSNNPNTNKDSIAIRACEYAAGIKNKELFFAIIDNDSVKHYPLSLTGSAQGVYNTQFNAIILHQKNLKPAIPILVHELGHKAIDLVFKNLALPYNDKTSKKKYDQAVERILLNIKDFIKQEFDHDVIFQNDNIVDKGYSLLVFTHNTIFNNENKESIDNPRIVINELKALRIILDSFRYDTNNKIAQEIIVRLAQVIANDLYEGKVVQILQPLQEYWDEFVSPSIYKFIDEPNGECLITGGYRDLFDYNELAA